MKKSLIGLSVVASLALADGSYTLGKVSVAASNADDINMIEKSITSADIAQNNDRTIADALDNVSGISMEYTGARSETKINIRGHSATRIGVFIDGIPVYVPYDGNFDFGRFLTNDIAEIDISKGYSSIAYGANTMGGVVNIVTKKPTKELEGNIRGEIVLDSDARMARHLESINVGSRVGSFYAQLSGSYTKKDHFRLSNNYTPVAGSKQPKGDRLNSETRDQKISLKLGYIADDMSEMAISYSKQEGQKEYPISVDKNQASESYRYTPFWDKETISVSGLKNFGNSYVKALAYYDRSDNSMSSYVDNTFSSFSPAPKHFSSHYDDYSYGARLEYGLETDNHFLKVAANYKKDIHQDYNLLDKITHKPTSEWLDKKYEVHTISLGIEDTYKITNDLEILAGISYDRLKSDKAYDSDPLARPGLDTMSAWNPQAALIYAVNTESKVKASVSQKTYLPSMKDRFSGKLGSFEPNPDLDREIATHYELGYTYKDKNLFAGTNIYFTKVKDAVQAIDLNSTLKQNQNVGDFEHKGFELDATYTLDDTKFGGNYSFIEVENKKDKAVKRTYVPKHQLFAFAQQKLGAGFSLYGNMKYRSGAYGDIYDKPTNITTYVKMDEFTTFDLKVIYEPIKEFLLEVGVKNIADREIEYSLGYPEAGREYFATMNYKF